MKQGHETFIHFDLCINRLNGARQTLLTIKDHPAHALVASAFRFALVEYATAYTRSDGSSKKRYVLSVEYVPKELLDLHSRLLVARNQVLAHVDASVLDARLTYTDVQGQRLVMIAQNQVTGLEELPNIDQILLLIEATLGRMYAARDDLKDELGP